jgi:hypothetical protein
MVYDTSAKRTIGGHTKSSAYANCTFRQGLLGAGALADATRAAIAETRTLTNYHSEVTSYYTPGQSGVGFKARAACIVFRTGDNAGHFHLVGNRYRVSQPPAQLVPGQARAVTASCPSGYEVTGGGGYDYQGFPEVRSESMDPAANSFTVRFVNPSAQFDARVSAEALCVTATTSTAG